MAAVHNARNAQLGGSTMSGSGASGSKPPMGWGAAGPETPAQRQRRQMPSFGDLERRAKWRVARFAHDYVSGGVGDGAPNVQHNRAAMDAVRVVPRYAIDLTDVRMETKRFGRTYNAPVGVAPMGNTGMVWPDADAILAAAAQAAGIPYCSSTVATVGMEKLAQIAPDSFWFQLYGLPADRHALSIDLIKRAEAVGAHALVITLDVPMRQKRVHDVRNGLVLPWKMRPKTIFDIARAPLWALEILKKGQPRFENLRKYAGENAGVAELAGFVLV